MQQTLRRLAPLVSVALFVVALVVLRGELHKHSYHEVLGALRSLPGPSLLLAGALAILGYALQTLYDTLGLVYARHPLAYRRTALASFIGYAFSNTIGQSLLTGGSIRFRLYSAWGLAATTITRVILFCSLSFWTGFMATGSVVLLTTHLRLPAGTYLPMAGPRVLGLIFGALVLGYLAASFTLRRPLKVRSFELTLPRPALALSQVAVGSLDWVVAASVLYVLLPSENLKLLGFLAAFLLAQLAGISSQVPGGLGVFETVMVVLLTPAVPATQVLGALVAYRFVYYLCPLATAALLLGGIEAARRRHSLARAARLVGTAAPRLIPTAMALACLVGGLILLISGATPSEHHRLPLLAAFVPLPIMELSHFLGSVAGAALLILAVGLQRRLDGAWLLAEILLGLGIVVSLLKGLDWEEASILAVMLLALTPCRRHFYRTTSLLAEPFSVGWVAAVVLVLVGSLWLGMFSYKHVEYSNKLWWEFELARDAPRFLRASAGAISVAVLFAVTRLLRPAAPRHALVGGFDRDRVRSVVSAFPEVWANLALLGDKRILWSDSGRGLVMYAIEGRSWVAMGGPIGLRQERVELAWAFRELVDRHGGWPVFYEVGREDLDLFLDLGLSMIKLGEEARVRLEGFTLEGHARKWLRYVDRKLTADGYTFELAPREAVSGLLPELEVVSNAWLAEKKTREKGFSLGVFDPAYLAEFPAALLRKEGRIVAFGNVWLGGDREELSPDLMRFTPDAPNGVMEYLFVQLMLWGREQGYRWFNLGMAPLSGLPNRTLAPLWSKVGSLVFRHGENFYNFQGIRRYKEKFEPAWEPRYLAAPGGLALPRVVANVATLISGGLKGVVAK
jgi:phosphatidylglycerol lysyltransferase